MSAAERERVRLLLKQAGAEEPIDESLIKKFYRGTVGDRATLMNSVRASAKAKARAVTMMIAGGNARRARGC